MPRPITAAGQGGAGATGDDATDETLEDEA
jgi:hypothetical protein